ncbi:Mu transposase domain-containing protein [Streptomyces caeruleatus]|uniref:Mu transposase domain-containing protein n=1 Tax=Streptomyces caeruleatus TaxID=661399 RepID=UPI00131DB484|nr:integrase core domain-containing protein [Streptomyces caeruleatus]
MSGYSRVITARMLPSRQAGDLIDAHCRLLTAWGAVPKTLLAIRVHLCGPRDPEAKGLVERANGYLETGFLPGRLFTGPDDFNAQLTAWLQIANRRHHRSIDARPVDRWESDRASMLAIPPVGPPHWWPLRTRLGRDHYIRVDANDYSVHPRAIGHIVTVNADTEEITVTCGDDLVALTHTAGPGIRA